MPRFLRIGNTMLHVPSLSSVTINTNCIGKPFIAVSYHTTKNILYLNYRNWEECQKDFNRVKTAMAEVEHLLDTILLTEPETPKQVQEPAKESEKPRELVDTLSSSTY